MGARSLTRAALLASATGRSAEHSHNIVDHRAVAVSVQHGIQGSQQSLACAGLLSRAAELSCQITFAYSFFAPSSSERAHHDRRQHHEYRPDLTQIESAGLTDALFNGALLAAKDVAQNARSAPG